MSDPIKVLVVDDDKVIREILKGVLERDGYAVELATRAEEAVELIQQRFFPIIISDINMFEMDGLALLSYLKESKSDSIVILMTGYGSLEGAVEAIHQGAFDYLSKPLKVDELRMLMERAVKQLGSRHATPSDSAKINGIRNTLIGRSPTIVQVYKTLAKASMSVSNVLIVGESGTGKELIARAIHANSSRKAMPFVTVNCGALADNLLESELFGHVRGAFTGAIANKRGLFEEADGGTIFLDEIGDITPALQVKLLRVIQEGEFKAVGTTNTRKVDVRIIAATHRDLDQYVRQGRFREDLYYRLKVILIELPPLRDRMGDLPELVNYFLSKYSATQKRSPFKVSDEAMALLRTYSWPGNIRELEHALERAVAMTSTSTLYVEDFPPEISRFRPQDSRPSESPAGGAALPPKSLEEMEREHIVKILNEVKFNKSKAADILGIDRATLYRKAQRYGIRLAAGEATEAH